MLEALQTSSSDNNNSSKQRQSGEVTTFVMRARGKQTHVRAEVGPDVAPVDDVGLDGIGGVDRVRESIHDGNLLDLLLEGTEHAIEDAQRAAVVLVDAVGVTTCHTTQCKPFNKGLQSACVSRAGVYGTVMNAMLARGIEDPFKRTELGQRLRMDPELIEQIVLVVEQEQLWRIEERQWHVVGPRHDAMDTRLSVSC